MSFFPTVFRFLDICKGLLSEALCFLPLMGHSQACAPQKLHSAHLTVQACGFSERTLGCSELHHGEGGDVLEVPEI